MNLYETEEFFKKMNPGKEVKLSFPAECHRQYEIVMTDGIPNEYHHCECHHVMVEVEGEKPVKVPIMPHRLTLKHAWFKSVVADVLKQRE